MTVTNAEKRRRRLARSRARGTHTAVEWESLKATFEHRCVRCGTGEYRVERDHIVPVYQNGSDSIENIQPVCARCNASKGPEAIDHRDAARADWRGRFAEIMAVLGATR